MNIYEMFFKYLTRKLKYVSCLGKGGDGKVMPAYYELIDMYIKNQNLYQENYL